MKVMIALVGGRPLPNILVTLQINPDILYFVVSEDSRGVGSDYEKTVNALPAHLKPKSKKYVKFVKPYSIEESIQACRYFTRKHLNDEIICHATLGPKTMAFGMYEVVKDLRMQGYEADICYLGREDLVWVFQNRIEVVQISLGKYFESYGWTVKQKTSLPVNERFQSLTALLAGDNNATQLLSIMRDSNRGKGKRTIPCSKHFTDEMFALLKKIEGIGVISNVQSNGRDTSWTINNDEDANFLLKGDWLEYYTYRAAVSLTEKDKPLFLECGWEIEDTKGKGEIDFAGILGGQLVIASCKTGPNIQRNWLDELYTKAEQLGKGMCTKLFISTVFKATRTEKDLDNYFKWAKERQIALVFAENIPDLAKILRKASLSDPKLEPSGIPIYSRI